MGTVRRHHLPLSWVPEGAGGGHTSDRDLPLRGPTAPQPPQVCAAGGASPEVTGKVRRVGRGSEVLT